MRHRLMMQVCLLAAAAVVGCSGRKPDERALLVYCGGSMRLPMEEIAKRYQEKYNRRVDLSVSDSGVALLTAQERRVGDAFVVHDPFAAMAEKLGLTEKTVRVAILVPAIAVKKGTKGEAEIADLADLAKPGLRLGVPDPATASCGQVLAAMLAKTDFAEAVNRNTQLTSRSSNDLVNALGLGTLDAVVAWDALIRRDPTLKLVPIADKYAVDAVTSATGKTYPVKHIYVTVSSLKSAVDPDAAAKFVDLAASAEGQAVFKQHGFTPVSETDLH